MQYYSLITKYGLNKQIQTLSSGQTIKLTKMAVGSGDGEITQSQTTLQEQKYEFFINSIEVDENNKNQLIATGVIPSNVGGFYIKEVGVFDDSKNLFAIGKIAPTYKPLLSEGSAKDLTIKFYLQVENVSNIELKIDPSVVIATRKWTLDNLNKKADKLDVYTKKETFNQDEINALIPAGTIIQSASQSTPGGYLKCNGASISRDDYKKLFEAIGTTFGSDDNNTFRLPDLRGRFIRGFSDGSSIDSGRAFGSAQSDENKEHYHLALTSGGIGERDENVSIQNYKNFLKNNGYAELSEKVRFPPEVATNFFDLSQQLFFRTFDFEPTMPTTKSGSESRPCNIALNFYIKY